MNVMEQDRPTAQDLAQDLAQHRQVRLVSPRASAPTGQKQSDSWSI